jgi:hypothetical protein
MVHHGDYVLGKAGAKASGNGRIVRAWRGGKKGLLSETGLGFIQAFVFSRRSKGIALFFGHLVLGIHLVVGRFIAGLRLGVRLRTQCGISRKHIDRLNRHHDFIAPQKPQRPGRVVTHQCGWARTAQLVPIHKVGKVHRFLRRFHEV